MKIDFMKKQLADLASAMDNKKFIVQAANILLLGITFAFVYEMVKILWWIQDGKKAIVSEPNSAILLTEISYGIIVIGYIAFCIVMRFAAMARLK